MTVHAHRFKYFVTAAALLALSLRALLYAGAIDHKGLVITDHWAHRCLWLLTGIVAAAMLLYGRKFPKHSDFSKAFPPSVFSAAGSALAGLAFLLSAVSNPASPGIANLARILRWCSGISLFYVAFCRLRGKKPLFLCHCAACAYLALRLVCQYRTWSSDPQMLNYVFYMGAHTALMLTAYQLAAFDVGQGNCKALWMTGLASVYLCITAMAACEERLFLAACALWIFFSLNRSAARTRMKPAVHTDE